MNTVLSHRDRELLLEFIDACHPNHRRGESRASIHSCLHALLPHEIFALARMHTSGAGVFQFYGPEFPKQYLNLTRTDDGMVRCSLLSRWVRTQRPLYYDEKYTRRNKHITVRTEAFIGLGLRNIAIHGVVDPSRNTATCFGFVRLGTNWCARTRTLLRLVTPHLQAALSQQLSPMETEVDFDELAGKKLTPREQEVLHWLSYGKTTSDISSILGIAANTVQIHTQNIVRKLEATNRVHAVAKAIRNGVIGL